MTKCETCGKMIGHTPFESKGCRKCGKYFKTCHNCERNLLCVKCKAGLKFTGKTRLRCRMR